MIDEWEDFGYENFVLGPGVLPCRKVWFATGHDFVVGVESMFGYSVDQL